MKSKQIGPKVEVRSYSLAYVPFLQVCSSLSNSKYLEGNLEFVWGDICSSPHHIRGYGV